MLKAPHAIIETFLHLQHYSKTTIMTDARTKAFGLRYKVEEYFERQAQQLLGASQGAASLTSHRGLYGSSAEDAVRNFLRNHLPERYGVGAGQVVSFDANSAEVDAVIFDTKDCFKLPISSNSSLYSVEGVYSVVSIKSSPSRSANTKQVINEAVSNIESVKDVSSPFLFSMVSQVPALTGISEAALLQESGQYFVRLVYPVSAILLLGTKTKFNTVVKYFRQAQERVPYWHGRTDLLCVIDEKEFGLYGFDMVVQNNSFSQKYWRETCRTPGQTLATFLYWLIHKMTFERIIERPMIYNSELQAVRPSVIAPVVPRISVGVDETGNQRSWPWPEETRVFE